MRTRILTITSAMSLLLFVATAVLWLRSYLISDIWQWTYWERDEAGQVMNRYIVVISGKGCFRAAIESKNDTVELPRPSEWDHDTYKPPLDVRVSATRLGRMGFAIHRLPQYEPTMTVPMWALSLIFAALPIGWSILKYRFPTNSTNLCPNCAYNLYANTSGICPECGKAVQQQLETST